jgi:hypothetical protein
MGSVIVGVAIGLRGWARVLRLRSSDVFHGASTQRIVLLRSHVVTIHHRSPVPVDVGTRRLIGAIVGTGLDPWLLRAGLRAGGMTRSWSRGYVVRARSVVIVMNTARGQEAAGDTQDRERQAFNEIDHW